MMGAPCLSGLPLVLDYLRREAEARWLADQPAYIRVMAACQTARTQPLPVLGTRVRAGEVQA